MYGEYAILSYRVLLYVTCGVPDFFHQEILAGLQAKERIQEL